MTIYLECNKPFSLIMISTLLPLISSNNLLTLLKETQFSNNKKLLEKRHKFLPKKYAKLLTKNPNSANVNDGVTCISKSAKIQLESVIKKNNF